MTPCREFQGSRTRRGYGYRYHRGTRRRIHDDKGMIIGWTDGEPGRYVYMHRWVWEQVNGPIPDGMEVMHICDNPSCFRYDHLCLGTHTDNMTDMKSKGRAANQFTGVTHCAHGHEFTPENTRVRPSGGRSCRACERERSKARRSR